MGEVVELIQQELAMAGMSTEMVEQVRVLEECRITPDTVIEQPEYLFQMFHRDCFPRGELVGVQGKMKSGKTFFCSMLMALCMRREVMTFIRNRPTGLRLLWIDTEQSPMSTQKILNNRIRRMIGAERLPMEQVEVFNLRVRGWKERLALAELAIRRSQPDLVIFDGIRDCVDDINDYPLANDVVTRLTRMASGKAPSHDGDQDSWPACCIVCVLHENKSVEDNSLRGAIGTELGNKCWELYDVQKDADTKIFTVRQRVTREIDITEPLKFFVNTDGLPEVLNAENEWRYQYMMQQTVQPNKEQFKNYDGTWDVKEIFEHLLGGGNVRSGKLFMQIKELLKVSNNQANDILSRAVSEGIIIKEVRSKREIYYCLVRNYNDMGNIFAPQDMETPF